MIPSEIYLPVLGSAVWYLVAAAKITARLRKLYPPLLSEWAACAACSGTWITAGLAILLDAPMLGRAGRSIDGALLAGLWGMATIPGIAWVMIRALSSMWAPFEDHGGEEDTPSDTPRDDYEDTEE